MTSFYLILFFCVFLISLSATGLVLKYLIKKAILDHPNERSSHNVPTPRGGGIGLLIAIIPSLLITQYMAPAPLPGYEIALLSTLLLAGLSWLDDLKNLGPAIRFATQIFVVAVSVYFLPDPAHGYLGGFLPLWIEKIILGLGWVWFINLFNFMDGIDGISGVEISAIGIGVALISLFIPLSHEFTQAGLIFAAAALGFLKWNWHKARVFMGDVGSIPLGYLLGWILILMAAHGYVIVALLLALYYLSDATLTLLKRALRKEKIWQAHREHFYQQAVKSGLRHDQVALRVGLTNIVLIIAALLSIQTSLILGLGLGIISVIFCLFHFAKSQPNS